MPPEHWECRECGASWSESKARKCLHCLSKDIFILFNPNKSKKKKK